MLVVVVGLLLTTQFQPPQVVQEEAGTQQAPVEEQEEMELPIGVVAVVAVWVGVLVLVQVATAVQA
jgi:hypothetical protein